MSDVNHIGMVISAYKIPRIGYMSYLGKMRQYPEQFDTHWKPVKHSWGDNVTVLRDNLLHEYRISVKCNWPAEDEVNYAARVLMVEFLIYEYMSKRVLLPIKFTGPRARLDCRNWLIDNENSLAIHRSVDVFSTENVNDSVPDNWIIRKMAGGKLSGRATPSYPFTRLYNLMREWMWKTVVK